MKALLNWRYYVLILLLTVTLFGVLGESDIDGAAWFAVFIISKVAGFLAGYIMYVLYRYWSSRNLIPELDELAKEED